MLRTLSSASTRAASVALVAGALIASAPAMADRRFHAFEVTITNLTKGPAPVGQVFSPPVIASHRSGISIFTAGEAASEPLVEVAENGGTGPLVDALDAERRVRHVQAATGPILPGTSESFTVFAKRGDLLSIVGMLVNTNDAFFAVNSVPLPRSRGATVRFDAVAYDAGSEANNEDCAFIPGPACPGDSGNDRDTEGAEGFVHIHNGVHGIGSLEPADNDWRNPVARVSVRRVY